MSTRGQCRGGAAVFTDCPCFICFRVPPEHSTNSWRNRIQFRSQSEFRGEKEFFIFRASRTIEPFGAGAGTWPCLLIVNTLFATSNQNTARFSRSLIQNTLSHDNFSREGWGVLQLLQKKHAPLVSILGELWWEPRCVLWTLLVQAKSALCSVWPGTFARVKREAAWRANINLASKQCSGPT